MIRGWEAREHLIGERYRLLYARAFDLTEPELIPDQSSQCPSAAGTLPGALDLLTWLESTNVGDTTLHYLMTAAERLAFD